ncbi:hypothetical protein M758_7G094900 [Ceratodon purpureus]|nr:hypothetical protein M758_7G094900 [Ceratodon purpureus]
MKLSVGAEAAVHLPGCPSWPADCNICAEFTGSSSTSSLLFQLEKRVSNEEGLFCPYGEE